MRTEVRRIGLGLAAACLSATAASAQVCERPEPGRVVCRFVTSRPEPLHIRARGWVRRTGARPTGELVLSVDGAPCQTARLRDRRRLAIVEVGCRGANPLVQHVAAAELRNLDGAEPAGVILAMEDSARLADLPREAGELPGPPHPRRPWPNPLRHLHLPHLGK